MSRSPGVTFQIRTRVGNMTFFFLSCKLRRSLIRTPVRRLSELPLIKRHPRDPSERVWQ